MFLLKIFLSLWPAGKDLSMRLMNACPMLVLTLLLYGGLIWRYIPRQNSTFCLQHCCFELMLVFTIQYSTSIIQHCAFTNQHPYFKFSVLRLHATFVCVCVICLHRNPTFLFSGFTHQHPYFKFTFRSFKCDIHAFHCYVDVRCVCCGAECDMLAAQCNILVGH